MSVFAFVAGGVIGVTMELGGVENKPAYYLLGIVTALVGMAIGAAQ